MNEIIDQLKSMPMLYFSLGGKELFHSNFLYWLATDKNYKHKMYEVLKELAGVTDATWNENNTQCKREFHNFDFSIWTNETDSKPVLLIENKVKSIPSVRQLNEYSKGIGNASCILLSLMSIMDDGKINKEKGEVGTENKWHYVSYKKYCETLKKHFGDSVDYVNSYCEFVNKLCELADKWMKDFEKPETPFFNPEYIEKYNEIRMGDVYEKLRASYIASLLNKEEMKKAEKKSSYTRGTGSIDITYPDDEKAKYVFCLQIQGDAYKRCIIIRDKNAGKVKKKEVWEKIWETVISDERIKDFLFFEDANGNNELWDEDKKMRNQDLCNKYITNDYIFLYRYKCLKKGITIKKVVKKIVEDYSRISDFSLNEEQIDKIWDLLK